MDTMAMIRVRARQLSTHKVVDLPGLRDTTQIVTTRLGSRIITTAVNWFGKNASTITVKSRAYRVSGTAPRWRVLSKRAKAGKLVRQGGESRGKRESLTVLEFRESAVLKG